MLKFEAWDREHYLGHATEHVRRGLVDGHRVELHVSRYSEDTAQIWHASVLLDGETIWQPRTWWNAEGLKGAKSKILHQAHEVLNLRGYKIRCHFCGFPENIP